MSGNQKRYIIHHASILFLLLFLMSIMMISGCKPRTHRTFHTPYFSIQYPIGWKAVSSDLHASINGPVESNYIVNLKADYNPLAGMNVNLFRETVEAQNQLESLPAFVSISEKELEINAYPALQRIIKTKVQLSANENVSLIVILTYLVHQDQLGVVLTAEIPEQVYLAYSGVINEMIQSFRFK